MEAVSLPAGLADRNAPGGKRLNKDAFGNPNGFQGNLPRNAIRGFPQSQADLTLRHEIPLGEKFKVQVRADAYNALNHPNFANVSPLEGANLAKPTSGLRPACSITRLETRETHRRPTPRTEFASPESARPERDRAGPAAPVRVPFRSVWRAHTARKGHR